jgi:hypothetical protein
MNHLAEMMVQYIIDRLVTAALIDRDPGGPQQGSVSVPRGRVA